MLIDLCCFNEKAPKCLLLCPESFWNIKPRLSNTDKQLGYDCRYGTGGGSCFVCNGEYHSPFYHLAKKALQWD